jgi:hypothetical protein
MSRLINFGLGEVCDRLSLLALKILYGELQGSDVTRERHERAALLVKLAVRSPNGRWLEIWNDLHAVHAALWLYEADLRSYRAASDAAVRAVRAEEIVVCAFRIQDLYDRRASLITQINSLVGDTPATKTAEESDDQQRHPRRDSGPRAGDHLPGGEPEAVGPTAVVHRRPAQ